jgi:hypothetical protein
VIAHGRQAAVAVEAQGRAHSSPKPAETLKGSQLINENKPLMQNSMASISPLPSPHPRRNRPPRPSPNAALNVPTPPCVNTYVMPLGRSVPSSTQPRPKTK